MRAVEGRPARSRRGTVAVVVSTMLALAPASALAQEPAQPAERGQTPVPEEQQAPAPEAPQPGESGDQAGQPNPFMFDSDAGMLTFFIKADRAADFERVMNRLHEALAKSEQPQRRQMAEGWKLYKAAEPGPNNTVLYVNFITPVLKGGDYTISKILAEVFPQEVQEIFPLYRDSFAGLSRAELTLIEDFGEPFTPKPASPAPSEPPPATTTDPAPPQP